MKDFINKFPNGLELQRITTLNKYKELYENNQYSIFGVHDIIKNQYKDVKDLMYLAHAIPARISEFYGDFVQGDTARLLINNTTGVKNDDEFVAQIVYENDLKEKIYDYAVEQSEFGYVVLLGYVDENSFFKIDAAPQDQYFPQADGSVIFATYKADPNDNTHKRLLLLTQHYKIEGGNVVIERQAFETNEKGVATKTIGLDIFSTLLGKTLNPTDTIEGLDELPIRQIDNGKRAKWGFGKSDYHDITPQLAEINERATHSSTQLLKNLDAKMVLPKSMFNEDGKAKYTEAYAMENTNEVEPKYIINSNPLLTETREHIMFELKMVSFLTGVPMFELLKGSMPERVEGLRMQLFSAVRKTDTKRAKIKRGIMDMFRIGFKMTNRKIEQDVEIKFGDVLPTDDLLSAETEATKVRSGLSSRKSAIKRLENLDDTQADDEMKQIANEDRIAGVADTTVPPTV